MRLRIIKYLLFLAGGVLFSTNGTNAGLASCQASAALSSIDFCFVFDCGNGAFGGLLQFCNVSSDGTDIFDDCPP